MQIKDTRIITISPWEKLEQLIHESQYTSIHLLCDENTHLHCLPHVQKNLPGLRFEITRIAPGELQKNIDCCQYIWSEWLKQGIERSSLILCLGGGVVTDLGGFCASVILRKVDSIYIPTSLMAMADAALGGKTGINFQTYKNQVGSFNNPKAIVIDPVFLNTLDERQMKNGFVEIIKHSLVQSPSYFQDLSSLNWPLSKDELSEYMKKSIRTKTDFVEKDFYETGVRKTLNFGHTIGHAIEAHLLEKGLDIYHGEAIASGMICESYISSKLFQWKENVFENIQSYLKPYCTQLSIPSSEHNAILQKMMRDKKNKESRILFSLLEQTGKPALDQKVTDELILKSLEYYN